MSYVIQNYTTYSKINRLSGRLYSVWLNKNITFILQSIFNSGLFSKAPIATIVQNYPYSRFFRYYFRHGLNICFTKSYKTSSFIIASSLNSSLRYWAFKSGLLYLESKLSNKSSQLVVSDQNFWNQIFISQTFIYRRLKNYYFRIYLIHLLSLVGDVWVSWRSYFSLHKSLHTLPSWFILMRFYNAVFIKIHTI